MLKNNRKKKVTNFKLIYLLYLNNFNKFVVIPQNFAPRGRQTICFRSNANYQTEKYRDDFISFNKHMRDKQILNFVKKFNKF